MSDTVEENNDDQTSEAIDRHLLQHPISTPDYTVLSAAFYRKFTNPRQMTLFKLWRQGRIMNDVFNRRDSFYKEPYWLLVFKAGPVALSRVLLNQTLHSIMSLNEPKKALPAKKVE